MTTQDDNASPVARARALAKAGRNGEAAEVVARLLNEEFGLQAVNCAINSDIYSLNSLNSIFEAGGEPLFFKFHQEENEGAMAGEYYRARLLADAGLPVDLPLHASSELGRQILVYRRRADPRFADVLRKLDLADDADGRKIALAAELGLNARTMEVYRQTLHAITTAQSAAEPIHRLFHERLVTPGRPGALGGRFTSYYQHQAFALPGLTIGWDELKTLAFAVNGVRYDRTLGQLFDAAFVRLRPDQLADNGGVTAHGDAHNANVWFAGGQLALFDPAFAGSHIPALLAEVKTTFHNVFAHPLWLYEPAEATKRYSAATRRRGDTLHIEHDWRPGPVRLGLMQLKAEQIWKPLLALLAAQGLLPADWRRVVKLALFLCPTLVMNLRAGADGGAHNPVSSAIGLATAVEMGAEPERMDVLSQMLDAVTPG